MSKQPKIPQVGEVLNDEFLKPFQISQNALAKALGVPQNRISDIINGKRGITADTDLRLTKFFGLSEGFFLGLQQDFEMIETKRAIAKELAKIQPYQNPSLQTATS